MVFGIVQFVTSNFISTPLTDIVASLVAAASVVLLLRVWKPSGRYVEVPDTVAEIGDARSAGSTTASRTSTASTATTQSTAAAADRGVELGSPTAGGDHGDHPLGQGVGTMDELAERDRLAHDTTSDVVKAYAPYLIIVALFVVTQLPGIKNFFNASAANPSFTWPGLDLQTPEGKPSTIPTFKLNILSAAGTLMIIAGLITIPVIGISPAKAVKAYLDTYRQLALAIVTVMAVLALAYVMNASGQTATLGQVARRIGWPVRDPVPDPRLARRRRHRFRHLVELLVRRPSGPGGQADRPLRGPHGGRELVRRRAGQDDLAAEPRHRRRRRRHGRPGGAHLPKGARAGPWRSWSSCA